MKIDNSDFLDFVNDCPCFSCKSFKLIDKLYNFKDIIVPENLKTQIKRFYNHYNIDDNRNNLLINLFLKDSCKFGCKNSNCFFEKLNTETLLYEIRCENYFNYLDFIKEQENEKIILERLKIAEERLKFVLDQRQKIKDQKLLKSYDDNIWKRKPKFSLTK
jgi:hypothetical protein